MKKSTVHGSSLQRTALSALMGASLALLAACGGGGGGGETGGDPAPGNPPAAVAPTLTVTLANSQPVAADALNAVTGQNAALTGTGLVTGVQVQQDAGSVLSGASGLAAAAQALLARAGGAAPLATGVAINDTVGCSRGGTLTVSGNVSSEAELSVGDAVTITASACGEPVGTTVGVMSGSMTFNVQQLGPQRVVMAVTARDLSVATLGVTSTSNGDLKLDMTQISPNSTRTTLTGTALTNSISGPGGSRSSTMRNYNIVQTRIDTQTTSSVTASVESTNPRIGPAPVIYQLTTPVPVLNDLALVLRGSIKVTGVNSSLLLTVTTLGSFSLEVDANGDGTVDSAGTIDMARLQELL